MAVTRPGATTLAPLWRQHTPSRALDIFHSAAAIAVLIDVRNPPRHRRLDPSTNGEALALTDREADVACLLAEGLAPADIAARLRMQPSTALVHLRSIYEKTGTTWQAKLVASFQIFGTDYPGPTRLREVRKKLRFSVKLQQLAGASEGRSAEDFCLTQAR